MFLKLLDYKRIETQNRNLLRENIKLKEIVKDKEKTINFYASKAKSLTQVAPKVTANKGRCT